VLSVIRGDIKIILISLSLMEVSMILQWLAGVGAVINEPIIKTTGFIVKKVSSIL
jgi:hypothetical protein